MPNSVLEIPNLECLTGSESLSDIEQYAEYIGKMSGELSKLAKNANLPMLSYLLGMAQQEATECTERIKRTRIN